MIANEKVYVMIERVLKQLTKCIIKGGDILILLVVLSKFPNSAILAFITIAYIMMRLFFLTSLTITFVLNFLFLFNLANVFLDTDISSEVDSYILLIGFVFIFLLLVIQYALIMIRAFNTKLEFPVFYGDLKKFIISLITFAFQSVEYVLMILMTIIYPAVLVLITIASFAGIYGNLNDYYAGINDNEGLFYTTSITQTAGSRISEFDHKISLSHPQSIIELFQNECVYYSAVTYFTTGYGDIVSNGKYFRAINIAQMLISNLLAIIIFSLYGASFFEYIKSVRKKEKEVFVSTYEKL